MRVAVIGSGPVGTALARNIVSAKPTAMAVTFGSRQPDSAKLHAILADIPGTTATSVEQAVASCQAVILAVPGAHDVAGLQGVADLLGPGVAGKVVIDATNPLSPYPGLEIRWDGAISGGEQLAQLLPTAHVFKAFNTVGVEHLMHPDGSLIDGKQLTMMYAGGPEGKDIAEQVVAAAGFIPEYVGPIRFARNLEALAELYIHVGLPGLTTGAAAWGRNFHFQVARAPAAP